MPSLGPQVFVKWQTNDGFVYSEVLTDIIADSLVMEMYRKYETITDFQSKVIFLYRTGRPVEMLRSQGLNANKLLFI